MMSTFKCDSCSRISIGAGSVILNPTKSMDAVLAGFQPQYWIPANKGTPKFEHLPDHINRAFNEVYECTSVNASMSAVLMCRTIIEATAKDNGVTKGQLRDKIDVLQERGIISEFIAKVGHTLRSFGNDMAHGDIAVEVSAEEAGKAVKFLEAFLQHVYELPGRLAEFASDVEERVENSKRSL